MNRQRGGFNLTEFLVLVAIAVALAGVVVPIMSIRRLDSQWNVANADLERLAGGIRDYIRTTHTFPTGHSGATSFHYLYTDGEPPENNVFGSGAGAHVGKFLQDGSLSGSHWSGPYLAESVGPDPWGHAYVVNVNGFFSSSERVILLSAGPNGQINTPPSATVASGDDIAMVLE